MKLKTLIISFLMSFAGLTASATDVWSGSQELSDNTGMVVDFSSFNLQRGDKLTITGSWNTNQWWHRVQFYTVNSGDTKGNWFAETVNWFFSGAAENSSTSNDFYINESFVKGMPSDGKVYISGFYCTITKIEYTSSNGQRTMLTGWSPSYYTTELNDALSLIEAGDIIRFSGTRGNNWGNIQFQSTWGGDTWQKETLNWQDDGWDLSESVSVVYYRNSADWHVKATKEGSYINIGGSETGDGTHSITAMIGETELTLEDSSEDGIYKKATLTAEQAAALNTDGGILTISGEGVHVGWVDIYNPVTPKFQQTYIPESGTFDVIVSEELATYAHDNNIYLYGCEFSDATVTVIYSPTVKIGSAEYATFSYNEKLDLTDIDAYAVTVDGSTAKLNSIKGNKVAANTGMIIYKEGGGAVRIPFTADETDVITNQLIGTATGAVSNPDNAYVLANKNNGVGFYKLASGASVPAGKAYLSISSSNAKEFFNFGTETAIQKVDTEETNNSVWYNLSGQRVVNPHKGIFIVNGKKVIIK